ncbi:MAG TPA: hypothetical protein VM599_03045, partial [Thermoanaerobaculia bacterium]|nr:hypothetical protein [Thermoanaerobaculia bacterium]
MTGSADRRAGLVLVAAAVALGAWLRLDGLGEPSLWLDELLNVEITAAAAERPWYDWLRGFERENGPLYYAAQLAAAPVDDREAAARLAPALVGIGALALMAVVGRRVAGWSGAVAATALLALSPLHVYYSREGRIYALLMLVALTVTAGLLERRSPRRAALLVAGGAVLAAYTAATAAPLLAALGVVGGGLLLGERRRARTAGGGRGSASRAGAVAALAGALLGAALVAGLYGRFPRPEPGAAFDLSAPEAASRWATAFTLSARDATAPSAAALLLLGAAGVGVVVLARRKPRAAWVLAGMAALPPLFALAALAFQDHWLSVRYLSPGLPAFVLLAAAGAAALGRGIARLAGAEAAGRSAWLRQGAVAIVVAALALPGFGACRREPYRKTDWGHAAALIEALGRPGEEVLAGNHWSALSLSFYLDERFPVVWIADPAEAERRARRSGTAWLVHAGHPPNRPFRRSLSRWPQVWRSPPEEATLAFHPDLESLRRNGGGEALERLPLRLGLDGGDPYFLGSGWSPVRRERGDRERGPARRFRSIEGREAWLLLPLPEEPRLELVLAARPGALPDGAVQALSVALNGEPLGTIALAPGWQSYSL